MADNRPAGVLEDELKAILIKLQSAKDEERTSMVSILKQFASHLDDFVGESSTPNATGLTPPTIPDLHQLSLVDPTIVTESTTSDIVQSPDPAAVGGVIAKKRKSNGGGSQDKPSSKKRSCTPGSRRGSGQSASRKPSSLKFTKSVESIEQLGLVSIGVNEQYPVAQVKEIRQQFYDKLLQLPLPKNSRLSSRGSRESQMMFNEACAAQVTNFFFEDIMGEAGLSQLARFVVDYTPEQEGEIDTGAANRLKEIGQDHTAPHSLRMFCSHLSASMSRKAEEDRIIGRVECVRRSVAVFDDYQTLSKEIENNAPAIWAYVSARLGQEQMSAMKKGTSKAKTSKMTRPDNNSNASFTTTQGRDQHSVAKDVLSAVTSLDSKHITAVIEGVRTTRNVLDRFGEALILLLPEGSEKFLKDTSKERVMAACDVLQELCPYIPEFINLLDEYVWQPYTSGARQLPINIEHLAPQIADTEFRLLDQIKQAALTYGSTSAENELESNNNGNDMEIADNME